MLPAAVGTGLAVTLAGAVAGCGAFSATLGQREAVVQFQPQTGNAVKLQVRAACSDLPRVSPEPLPTDHLASDHTYDVRYRIDQASDGYLARLQQCLQKFRSVTGIAFTGPGGS
jgi:hypothetical protein